MKHLSLFKIFTILILFAVSSACSVKLTYAQQPAVSLSPASTELAIQPGQSASIRYKFTNTGDPIIAKFRVESFNKKEESLIKFEILNDEIKLNEELFLKNSVSEEILLNISIPQEIEKKDYYFNFIAETDPPPPEEGKGNFRAKITLQSPLLIVVTSTGQVEIKPKVSIFDLLPSRKITFMGLDLNLMNSFTNVPVVLVIENTGKNLIKPRGEITVRGILGKPATYPVEPVTVLAGSQKRIGIEIPGRFMGNYKVAANLNFGNGTPTYFSSSSFLVIPSKLIITLIILLFLFIVVKKKLKKL